MDLSDARWFKSSFSGGNGGSCVEVAFLDSGQVAMRDTKDRTLSAHVYTAAEWDAFVAGVRAGEFSLARAVEPTRESQNDTLLQDAEVKLRSG